MSIFASAVLVICVFFSVNGQVSWPEVREEIAAQQGDVNRVVDYVLNGAGRHGFYDQLAVFSDDHGPRMSGTKDLEDAIDFTIEALEKDGFVNVTTEAVTVPSWIRGKAEATMIQPRNHSMVISALGTSVGTTKGAIEASVLVVTDFEDLESRKDEVLDKIVVYNQKWENYGQSSEYRRRGASEAARHGAVAALVRSATGFSIYSVHTGVQEYEKGVVQIPVASVTVEDAEMMARLQARGKNIVVRINMTCENRDPVTSRNVVADYPGSKYPNEYVIIGGHIDTWDVGFGPMDDGGGVIMSWNVVKILQALDLRPKRTIRCVFWTGEEYGLFGGDKYFEEHKENNSSISLIMESDSGTIAPRGIGFTGSGLARAMMEDIVGLTASLNTTYIGPSGSQADIGKWLEIGVPGGNLEQYKNDYFHYHHSNGDSMTMEDPDVLDVCAALWTAVTYVVANLEEKLPRSGEYPDTNIGPIVKANSCTILAPLFIIICCKLKLYF